MRRGGEIGRRNGLKIRWSESSVPVRFRPPAVPIHVEDITFRMLERQNNGLLLPTTHRTFAGSEENSTTFPASRPGRGVYPSVVRDAL